MRVLFLTNVPAPYRVDFFNELGKLCDLTVLYELKNASNRDVKWINNNKRNFKEVILKGVRVKADAALCVDVLKYLNNSYDIIIIGGYSTPTGMLASLYMRLKKIPYFLNSDGGYVKKEPSIIYYLKKLFISSATYWLSTGKDTDEYLEYYGAQRKNIFHYPFTSVKKNKILIKPIEDSFKKELKRKLNIIEDDVIVCVGQFIERKGIDVLIQSSKIISDKIGIYIIGGIPTADYLQQIKELELRNIYFIDFIEENKLTDYYKAADLFVLPTREDIWGLVINEAMANGLPIITTDKCIAGKELVYNNGIIIESDNIYELANAIETVLNNKETRKFMAKQSLEIIKDYTIEQMAIRHHEIFLNVIKDNI